MPTDNKFLTLRMIWEQTGEDARDLPICMDCGNALYTVDFGAILMLKARHMHEKLPQKMLCLKSEGEGKTDQVDQDHSHAELAQAEAKGGIN